MAIHSAKILSELLIQFFDRKTSSRHVLEAAYIKAWKTAFQKRLSAGKLLNIFLSNQHLLNTGVYGLRFLPGLLPFIIKQTHGDVSKF